MLERNLLLTCLAAFPCVGCGMLGRLDVSDVTGVERVEDRDPAYPRYRMLLGTVDLVADGKHHLVWRRVRGLPEAEYRVILEIDDSWDSRIPEGAVDIDISVTGEDGSVLIDASTRTAGSQLVYTTSTDDKYYYVFGDERTSATFEGYGYVQVDLETKRELERPWRARIYLAGGGWYW